MKLELKIVDLLAKDVEKKSTINNIAKTLGEFYSLVHRTVDKLCKEGVIVKTKVGKSYICSLNLDNEKTFTLLTLSEIESKEEFYSENKELGLVLEDFTNSLKAQNANMIAIVLFGSYAKHTAVRSSDIDILVISRRRNSIEKTVKEIYAKYGKEISSIVMTPDDLRKQKDKAIVREIAKDHYVLYGADNFINLVLKNES